MIKPITAFMAALTLATAPAMAQVEKVSCQAEFTNEYTGQRQTKTGRGTLNFVGGTKIELKILGQTNTFTFIDDTRLRDQNGTIWTWFANDQGFVFGEGDLVLMCAPGHY